MNSSRLDKIFNEQFGKLKRIRLKSDPVNANNSYEGYMLSEQPQGIPASKGIPGSKGIPAGKGIPPVKVFQPVKDKPVQSNVTSNVTEPIQSITGTVGGTLRKIGGGTLKKIGSAYEKLQSASEQFKKLGTGDLSILADWGNKMLDKIYDKQTGKINLLGKLGYKCVNLNDGTLISKLNEYSKMKKDTDSKLKESFIDRINILIAERQGQMFFRGMRPPRKSNRSGKRKTRKSLIYKELEKIDKIVDQLTDEEYEEFVNWLHSPKALEEKFVVEIAINERLDQAAVTRKNPKVKKLKLIFKAFEDPKALKKEAESIYAPAKSSDGGEDSKPFDGGEDSKPLFNESNLFFKISGSKKFPKGVQFVLEPANKQLLKTLNSIGVKLITLFRDQNESVATNTVTVYFYSNNRNIIPELTIPGLHYIYDATKKCYVVNSKIASKTVSVGFEKTMPVAANLVDIIYQDNNKKNIGFTFKPEAFKETFKNYTDQFTKKGNRRGKPGTIYASVSAPFQLTEAGDFYLLDLSRMSVSFDRNAKFVEDSIRPSEGK